MKVMKFGGTSVGKPERMKQIASLLTKQTEPAIVVLSALSGTTNALVEIGDNIAKGDRHSALQIINNLQAHYENFIRELLTREDLYNKAKSIVDEHFDFLHIILKISFSEALSKDILAQGELLSTKIFCTYLEELEWSHVLLPALEFMSIDENEEPQIGSIRTKLNALLHQHKDKKILVTQGYICRNAKGEVDNLKRGGSDFTASLIAAAIGASVCEIWTDIDGMHNNDPRIVKKTVPVEQLSFDEAAELAYFGAKILHPASIWPAQQYKIPVRLLNTMDPDAKGTLITQEAASAGVKAVAAKDNIIAIKIKSGRMLLAYGFLRRVFEVFEKHKTSIDMISTSEVAVSITIDDSKHLDSIVSDLKTFGTIEVDKNQTIICIVGNKLEEKEGVLKAVFQSLAQVPVRMVSYGGSSNNISLLVDTSQKEKALNLLNEGLFGL